MTQTLNREEEFPAPKYEVLKKVQETSTEKGKVEQWLVKCQHKHMVRIIHPVQNDKVRPPSYGQTEHVLVTQRTETVTHNDETKTFTQTTVYASSADGDFYDAVMYAAPGILDMWQIMYAIGEI